MGTVWSIAQVEQGLPARNQTFPGGMDAALPYDLPRQDWSVAFRPHQLGFLFLDAAHSTAWRWWIPGLALIAAAWAFLITVIPKRPATAATLSLAFFFSPFFQWWYQPTTFWPVTWSLATIAAMVWSIKAKHPGARWIWALIVSYLTIVMAMGIYAPFMVPVVLVVLFFAVGVVVDGLRRGTSWPELLTRLAPTLLAGIVAGAVTLAWLQSKAATVTAFLNTVYPGQRLTPTGSGNALSVARTISSSFAESLVNAGGFLGINSSEASTFFLVGAFLLPVVAWAVHRQARSRSTLPWVLIGLTAVIVLFIAFLFVPGWNGLAHILFLDRSTADRIRIGVGVASFAILGYLIRYLDDERTQPGRFLSASTVILFLISQVAIAAAVVAIGGPDKLWKAAPFWWLSATVSAATLYLLARRHVAYGAAAFLLVTVASSVAVNPVYVGVFDLRQTDASRAIVRLNDRDPGQWVGIGDPIVDATLIESGVTAYNGTQGAPTQSMWKQIDPTSKYAFAWNRLGGVNWVQGSGEPTVTNPFPDQIVVTFDSCARFAQQYVTYVFSNKPLQQSCLKREASFTTPSAPLTIYRIVRR